MADPPKPYDALSLLFECAKYGGVEKCAFFLPAGHRLMFYDPNRRGDPRATSAWYRCACITVTNNEGYRLHGEEAVLCIAAQQLSIQQCGQITNIAPANLRSCECHSCEREAQIRGLASLLGVHPNSNED